MRRKNRNLIALLFLLGFSTVIFLLSNRTAIFEAVRLAVSEGHSFRYVFDDFLSKLPDILMKYSTSLLWAYGIFIAGVILLEERNPDRTIRWLLVLILLPGIGFLLYIFLGPDIRIRKNFRRLKKRKPRPVEAGPLLSRIKKMQGVEDSAVKTAMLLFKNSRALPTQGNQVAMLLNGSETYIEIKKALWKASSYIYLEFYAVHNDKIGNEIKDILIAKAKEGLTVKFIYDSVGSWKLGKKYVKELKDGGVHVHSFLPISFPMLRRDLNYRNHRKIVVVDGVTGFMGGLNIGDHYIFGEPGLGFWRDTHLKIEGPAVGCLEDIFNTDCLFCDREHVPFERTSEYVRSGNSTMQIVASGPDSNWQSIHQGYFSLITNAKKFVLVTTPYLVPGESLLTALTVASLSGLDVRVLIPRKGDNRVAHWATLSNVEELLKAGVKVYSYQKGFIHSKILVADDSTVSVGTANLDARSLEINFEVQAFIYDRAVAKDFIKAFRSDLKHSQQLRLHEWLKRPLRSKMLEKSSRLWSSQL